MTISVASLVIRIRETLLDPQAVRWSDAEIISYLNAAVSALVSTKPDLFVVYTRLAMVAGVRQFIPADGDQFVEAYANSAGAAVRMIDRLSLDDSRPNWSVETAGPTKHVMLDGRDKNSFLVYPPASAGLLLEIGYIKSPARMVPGDGSSIPVPDQYENALYYFTLAHAYAKNAKRGDTGKFSGYMSMFTNVIGAVNNSQNTFAPTLLTK